MFEKHVKNLFWNKILALLRSILGDFFMAKILPNAIKIAQWQNFALIWSPCAETKWSN